MVQNGENSNTLTGVDGRGIFFGTGDGATYSNFNYWHYVMVWYKIY